MTDQGSFASQGYVKVEMTGSGGQVETLWAVRVGPNRFRIDNLPFFAYGVSHNDVVEGTEYAPGMYRLVRVVEPSGNRLVRVILADEARADTPAGREVIDGLKALGCGLENMNNRLLSVTVPPEVRLRVVADYLIRTGLVWEYANPTYEELFG